MVVRSQRATWADKNAPEREPATWGMQQAGSLKADAPPQAGSFYLIPLQTSLVLQASEVQGSDSRNKNARSLLPFWFTFQTTPILGERSTKKRPQIRSSVDRRIGKLKTQKEKAGIHAGSPSWVFGPFSCNGHPGFINRGGYCPPVGCWANAHFP